MLLDDLQLERESYDALVVEGGTPAHPVELGFDVLEHPGEYKDAVSYWKINSDPSRRRLFTEQPVVEKIPQLPAKGTTILFTA